MAVDLVLGQAAELSDVWAAQPSVTDMGLRYTALLAKRGSGEMTLADQRELRRLEAELMELGELQANEPPPLLMAAEEPAGST